MAGYEVSWTEPALMDLDAIADFIALEDPLAAKRLVSRVFEHVESAADHPRIGKKLVDFPHLKHREIVEPPCRIFYRVHVRERVVLVIHVMRAEQRLRIEQLY